MMNPISSDMQDFREESNAAKRALLKSRHNKRRTIETVAREDFSQGVHEESVTMFSHCFPGARSIFSQHVWTLALHLLMAEPMLSKCDRASDFPLGEGNCSSLRTAH
jgi:protein tyrosine phosphatase (PTP) superfamily phosphohydrolase (DUF442 family)